MSFSIFLHQIIILCPSFLLILFSTLFPVMLVEPEPGGVTVPMPSNCTGKQWTHCSGNEQGIKTQLHDKELETDFENLLMTSIKEAPGEGHSVYKGLIGNQLSWPGSSEHLTVQGFSYQ